MRWTRMLLAMIVALFALAPAAHAATYQVITFGDDQGASCDAGGSCGSIRAAVVAAAQNPGPDTVRIPNGDFQLAGSQILLDSDVAIVGNGARATTVRGNTGAFRAFEVAAGVTASITGVTLNGGRATSSGPNTGFQPGGLIRNNGTLTLDRVRVTRGFATSGGGVANIGGTLTIERSLIDGNDGGSDAGGVLNFQNGTATIRNTTITDNRANTGGGYFAWRDSGPGGTGRLESVTIAQNIGGGGLNFSPGETVQVRGSIFVANSGGNCLTVPQSLGGNVESGTDCQFEVQNAQNVVGALENLGGDTDVFALPATSAARDLAAQCPATDQRGLPRPLGLNCDAGALEADAPLIAITSPGAGTATEAATVELRGTAFPTATVTVFRAGAQVAQTRADAQGVYAVVVPLDLGEQTFEVESESARASVRVVRTLPAQPTPTPTPVVTPTPTPVVNRTIVVDETRGTVKVKLPRTNRYVDLNSIEDIPVGSEIDTRKGRVALTSIPKAGAPPETAVFYDGLFKVTQTRGITDLTLTEPLAACPKGRASSAAAKKKSRKLWGDGKGSFRTTGKHSAATVRGTRWLVEDSCAGTRTTVKQGSVSVRHRSRTIIVRAGKSYLARPR